MVEHNPHADNLILKDISIPTFKSILDYMYEGKLNDTGANIELFAACHKLEMEDVAKLAAKFIKRNITKENAYDVLVVANKYDNYELRTAAYKEFKKNFPNKKMTDDIASKPEILQKIMSAKLAMDEAFAKLEEGLDV
jgi:lysine/ornithine N-monooxygenase